MRCEICQGTGFLDLHDSGPNREFLVRRPCWECGGCAILNCCEGLVETVRETPDSTDIPDPATPTRMVTPVTKES